MSGGISCWVLPSGNVGGVVFGGRIVGNGPFDFGWTLALPQLTRKTDKGLPQYVDARENQHSSFHWLPEAPFDPASVL